MLQHSLQLLRLFALPSIASYFLFISMLKVDSLHAGPCHLGVGGGGSLCVSLNTQRKVKIGTQCVHVACLKNITGCIKKHNLGIS